MLDPDKIIKIDICTMNGNLLLSVGGNFSFPKKFVDGRMVDNVMMVKGKNLPVFASGAMVNAIVFLRSGDRVSYKTTIDISTDFQLNLTLDQSRAQLLEERRRYFKMVTENPCKILSFNRGDEMEEFDPTLTGIIKNINLGGVFLAVDDDTPVGRFNIEDVLCIVTNMADTRMELFIKILRKQITQQGELMGYGCCFLMLNSKQEALVSKYINRLQLEKRAQERGR